MIKDNLRDDIPSFKTGDTLSINVNVREGKKAVSYTHLTLPTILRV